MNCPPFDLKDYFFGELDAPGRAAVEQHVAACLSCREELGALGVTRSALMSVADEEPPRRIAFVSDKVFEPRWWQKLWRSGPQLGFASAAMLAAAIVMHGYGARSSIAPIAPVAPVAPVAAVQIPREAIEAEVAKAVAATHRQQLAQTLEIVNARLKDARVQQREQLLQVAEYLERLDKRQAVSVSRAVYQ